MRRAILLALGIGASLAISSTAAYAQASITGVVRDTSGGVLPGVTVEASSPALIERVRTAVTDGTGQYRIVDLRPGEYTVTFSLAGFNVVRREGLALTGSFTATVNAEMRVGGLEETITVTGESPIVDVQRVTQQRVFDQEVTDAIPAGRSYMNVAVLIPGLQAAQAGRGTVADVGGTSNLQTTRFTIHGGRQEDTRVSIDGVRIGNGLATSSITNFVPDAASTQEITIDYGSASAEQPYAGLRIELIPREGSNTFRGTVFAFGLNDSWQSDNLTQELQDQGLPEPDVIKRAYDVNPSFGGPLVQDKLWFYTSARWQGTDRYVAGVYANKNAGDPNLWTREEDLSQRGLFTLDQSSVNTRLTWQAAPKHKLSIFYENQGRIWDNGRAGLSPEMFVQYRFPINRLASVGWTSPLTNRLLAEVRVSNRGEAFKNQLPPEGDPYRTTLIPVQEQSDGIWYHGRGGNGGASAVFGGNTQKINNVSATASYVTGAHALKVGATTFWSQVNNSAQANDHNVSYRLNNAVPNRITMHATPFRTSSKVKAELGFFVQDQWTVDRVTLNLGVRYDQFIGGYPVQELGPVLFLPNRNLTFPEVTGNNFKDVTPRVGLGYDLFGDGKTAVKVNIGRYVQAASPTGNPAGVVNAVTRSWNDANQDYRPDCDLLNLRANGECGTVSNLNFGQPTSVTEFNPETRFGWGNRFYSWEFSTSVQRELMPRLGIDIGYFRRWYGNFLTTQNRATTAADYDTFGITAPSDPRLPSGGGYVIDGLYDLTQAKVGQVDNYQTFADDFGKRTEHWNGVDVSVNARMQSGLVVQGGVSTGRTSTDDCEVRANNGGNPSPLYCHVDTKFLTHVKLLGAYTLPKWDVNLAATMQSTPGNQITANFTASNALIAPSLGRNLSGGSSNRTVNLVSPGTLYNDRINQLDFRVGKILRFGSRRAAINLDIYNALNSSATMNQNNNYAVWQTPQRILEGRLLKVSGQLDF